jgi:hypothetical protein
MEACWLTRCLSIARWLPPRDVRALCTRENRSVDRCQSYQPSQFTAYIAREMVPIDADPIELSDACSHCPVVSRASAHPATELSAPSHDDQRRRPITTQRPRHPMDHPAHPAHPLVAYRQLPAAPLLPARAGAGGAPTPSPAGPPFGRWE